MRYKIDKLVQLIMDYRGKTPKKLGMNWTENQCDIVALSAKNIKDNKIVNTDKSHYGSESLYKRWMKDGDIEPGDILITSEAPLGEVYLITKPIKAILSQRLFLLRFNKNIVNPWYIFAFMNSQSFKNKLFSKATGTTVVGIKQKELRKIEIDLPNIRLQNKVGDIFRVIYKKIIINEIINDNLMEQLENEFNDLFFKSFPSNSLVLSSLVIKTIAGDWGKTTLQKNFDTKTTIIRGTDFQDITMGRSSNAPTRYVKKKNLINKELQQSDVVVEISGGSPTQSTGRSLLITNEIKNSFKLPILGTNFTRTFKTENLENAILLKSYLQFLYLKRLFFNYENGTTGIKNLDYKNVLNIKLPDVRTNKLFKNYIKKYILFYKFIIKLGKQNKTLESIKDAFLKLYF